MKKPDQKIRNYFSLAAGITQEDSIKKKHLATFQSFSVQQGNHIYDFLRATDALKGEKWMQLCL